MTALPSAGVRAIDPGPFRLRLERSEPPAGSGLDAVRLDRHLRPFGPRGKVPLAARLASGLLGGFQWDREDTESQDWYPQGIDGRDRWLLVSWYSRLSGAARVSVVDTESGAYGHLALVTADGKPIKTHAGGLAWREDLLYAADTMNGLRVFDLTRIAGGALPQSGRYRPVEKGLRFSFASVDEAAGSLLVGEYLDRKPGARLVRWPFAPGGRLAQEPASDAWVAAHANLQGALVFGGRLLLAESQARVLPGTLWASPFVESVTKRRWGNGCEDLAAVGGNLVSVTEHPDLRWPLPRRRTVFRARTPD